MKDSELVNKIIKTYNPLAREFFNNLNKKLKTNELTEDDLSAVPGLFIPSCGDKYADSPIRIVIVGKETKGWNGSLSSNLDDYNNGKYDVLKSQKLFREEGPAEWRNNFWKYAAEALACIYGLNGNDVLKKESMILKSIAWSNCHAIETYDSKEIKKEVILKKKMDNIQEIASNSQITSLEKLVDCFKPNVIIYMYGSNDSYIFLKNATPVEENGIINEYKYGNTTIILNSRHPSWMVRGNVDKGAFASTIRDALLKYKLFKPLNAMPFYSVKNAPIGSPCFKRFKKLITDKACTLKNVDNQTLAHHLTLSLAQELRKENATMSAILLVTLLNQIPQFNNNNFLFTPIGRGPASFVRGVYNSLSKDGKDEEAESVALSFTGKNGNYCYK